MQDPGGGVLKKTPVWEFFPHGAVSQHGLGRCARWLLIWGGLQAVRRTRLLLWGWGCGQGFSSHRCPPLPGAVAQPLNGPVSRPSLAVLFRGIGVRAPLQPGEGGPSSHPPYISSPSTSPNYFPVPFGQLDSNGLLAFSGAKMGKKNGLEMGRPG